MEALEMTFKKGRKKINAEFLPIKVRFSATGVTEQHWMYVANVDGKAQKTSDYTYGRRRDAVRGLKRAFSLV
jgi:hypothetical protein